jgi:hypothetical protein
MNTQLGKTVPTCSWGKYGNLMAELDSGPYRARSYLYIHVHYAQIEEGFLKPTDRNEKRTVREHNTRYHLTSTVSTSSNLSY